MTDAIGLTCRIWQECRRERSFYEYFHIQLARDSNLRYREHFLEYRGRTARPAGYKPPGGYSSANSGQQVYQLYNQGQSVWQIALSLRLTVEW